MTTFFVNGINDSAAGTTDRCADYCKIVLGMNTVKLRYETTYWWQTRNRARWYATANLLLDQMRQYDRPWSVVGHSWGCSLIAAMLNHAGPDEKLDAVVFFNAALNKNWQFPLRGRPGRFDRMTVVRNPHDAATWIAGKFPFDHPFGRMGNYGYCAKADPRIVNKVLEFKNRWNSHNPFKEPRLLKASGVLIQNAVEGV